MPSNVPVPPPSPPTPWLMIGLALLAAAALGWHGPVPQWPDYHHFADTRAWGSVRNAADVLSNLPFAVAGLWGAWRLRDRARAAGSSTPAWAVFAAAVACTAVGSSAYHWQPDNASLVFDRLPIAWACAALLCAFLAERVDPRWAGIPALVAAVSLGSVSVAWWWFSDRQGVGDLRPYLYVQFLPMLLVPTGLLLRLPPRTPTVLPASAWVAALLMYAAAKGFEMGDHAVLQALGFVSGHTLKHLMAAGAAGWLIGCATREGGSAPR